MKPFIMLWERGFCAGGLYPRTGEGHGLLANEVSPEGGLPRSPDSDPNHEESDRWRLAKLARRVQGLPEYLIVEHIADMLLSYQGLWRKRERRSKDEKGCSRRWIALV